ncbi:MAG: flagellar filament capping protein FliD [Acidobacteriia bacterium]|nr:flagellar filament capping protein FliD [Terriglobia bacterium]
MGTIGSIAFTGLSTYSSDFQSILDRANQIAQIPITTLQNTQSDNLGKKQALIALNPAVDSLGSALAALGNLSTNQGLTASSSDPNTVSMVNTGATSPASYIVSDIQSVASTAWATSTDFVGDPSKIAGSSSGQVNLTVGSNSYTLQLTSDTNTLNGLRDAINAAGAGVSATILTSGTDNYLSISATNTGQAAITLQDIPKVDLITNTGSGSETSLAGYADPASTPVSATGKIDLVAGSTTYHLDITGSNNLNGLVDAINNAGAGLTASVTNVSGTNYLTVSGAASLQLNDLQAPVNLIANSNAGSNADFMLNNTIHVVRSSNTVSDIIPGVSFTLKNQTAGSFTLSLTADPSQLSNALQTFVNSYNTLLDDVSAQIGSSAGPLSGDLLIRDINSDMQQLATYWNTGSSIRSLSDLGVAFEDNTGHLTFNANTFDSLSASQMSDAYKFLGSPQSGLAMLASNFTQLSDPVTGLIRVQEDGYDSANTQLNDQINTMQDRATQAQNAMTAKIQAADALVAQLQSQQTNVDASLNSLNYVLYGRQTNVNGL